MATEWLHNLILDAKIELERNPSWLKLHHVLQVSDDKLSGTDEYIYKAGDSLLTKRDV